MDRNEVKLSGVAISEPTNTRLPSRVNITSFLLQVNEYFVSGEKRDYHPNVISVEALGKHADTALDLVKKGGRYEVTGYLRVESGRFCVRTFAITREIRDDNAAYLRGLETALETVLTSRSIEAAAAEFRRIIQELK